mmetsp:Transcript_49074/g.158501  ORF Transcript_49074/g.158501 Transcript_49074/m.158501 type:complete len:95 (-) Transcript_49074:138-422(-)
MAMRSWNMRAQPVACCRFHSAVKELRASVKRLEKWKCMQTFRFFREAQCSKCGILSLWLAEEDDDEDEEQEPRYCACCSGRYVRKLVPPSRASL